MQLDSEPLNEFIGSLVYVLFTVTSDRYNEPASGRDRCDQCADAHYKVCSYHWVLGRADIAATVVVAAEARGREPPSYLPPICRCRSFRGVLPQSPHQRIFQSWCVYHYFCSAANLTPTIDCFLQNYVIMRFVGNHDDHV